MAALGMIEVYGFATSIVVADACAKAADVKIVAIDRNKPANADQCEVPLVMVVKFEGNPAAVEAAHDAGVAEAERRGLFITSKINSGLSPEVEWFAHLTATGRDKLRNYVTVDGKNQYFVFSEKQRNAPDACQCYNRKYNTAYNSTLTAKDPADNIELKQTDRTPVDCTDNGNCKNCVI